MAGSEKSEIVNVDRDDFKLDNLRSTVTSKIRFCCYLCDNLKRCEDDSECKNRGNCELGAVLHIDFCLESWW